ncbi:hypothetical protein TcarDRAFT_1677 [Thermosinus carboxydivorans Nor1]|uniref:Uncharacterized protein n=1 Tax=Thermosinus carboxydivorans Nor1 TaxID=401526 RepID=A1HP22_9FIRM|nr:hypothetical protein [Thermosinus carboxydivorans]EAX48130.1 hypothetical protein TcarDRAFT_1677 [Thermosinus carboxydivorans Nor1]
MGTNGSIVEHSIISRKNVMVMGVVALLFLAWAAFTAYRWFYLNIKQPSEAFFLAMLAFALFERSKPTYVYEAGKKMLRITKHGLFGTDVYEIPYKDIFGIYQYKAQLIRPVKFRRTYRLHSALDNRRVWTVAYMVPGKKGKPENRRVYFKPSETMLRFLQEKMPNKVMVPEEQVVVDIIKNTD